MITSSIGADLLLATLKNTFGYMSFRPLQQEIVQAILRRQDVFVLMPTGGGKSLCYQLPALLVGSLFIVVSPLIALMKDQVDSLRALGVPATFINSSLDLSQIGQRQSAVARGQVKLLYVAPERLMQPSFLHLLSSVPLGFIAIDEAHCISEWGHDFRPEYRTLSQLRKLFPSTPVGAFTATATPRVQADIARQLKLQNAASFHGSFNRQNLFYEVRAKQRPYDQLLDFLKPRRRASGIIYCHTRDSTERLAARLIQDGFGAAAYHAGLPSDERSRRQEAFVRDDVFIIVATIAFGMGIDKPDVRFVVHYDLPKSLEGYYQESGRAGRDGEPSDCVLFYSYADAAKHRHFIDQKPAEEERRVAAWQLQQMLDWATGSSCRRRSLLAYFGERLAEQADPCCDVCQLPRQEVDSTVPAQMFLSCAKRTGERFGAGYLIDILRGSRAERILRLGHDKLSTFAIGSDLSKEEWARLAHELRIGGYVRATEDGFNVLKVTERGHGVLFNNDRVVMNVPTAMHAELPGRADTDDALFQQLRALRKRLADDRGVPPYVIFHDSSLREMADRQPANSTLLLQVQGVGQKKVSDFGDAFLACIRDYAKQHPRGQIDTLPAVKTKPRRLLGDTIKASVDRFLEGQSIEQIAVARELACSTIERHLAEALQMGTQLPIERLVSDGKRREIEGALVQLGNVSLRELIDYLGEGYTYAELRFVRAVSQTGGTAKPNEQLVR